MIIDYAIHYLFIFGGMKGGNPSGSPCIFCCGWPGCVFGGFCIIGPGPPGPSGGCCGSPCGPGPDVRGYPDYYSPAIGLLNGNG